MHRRQFLKYTCVSGAMVLAINIPFSQKVSASQGEKTFWNVYIVINPDNSIDMSSPVGEMGQFMRTTVPMMLAEEMDLDWSLITFNKETPMHLFRDKAGTLNYQYADMDTGGSWAVKRNWEPMRKMGAIVRRMLIEEAAERWAIEAATLTTENSLVIHRASNRRFSYGELAEAASRQTIDNAKIVLKDKKDYRIMGSSQSDIDLNDIVRGKPIYGIDARYAGALQAVIVRAPYLGADPYEYDDKAALAINGVKKIIEIPKTIDDHWMSGKTTVVPAGVAVLATSLWAAMKARDVLNVKWKRFEEFQGQDSEQQIESFHKIVESENPVSEVLRDDGDTKSAMQDASLVINNNFEKPLLAHVCMEPFNCIADIKGDKATLVVGHQFPKRAAEEVESITGIKAEHVKFVGKRMGGGFGRRARRDFVAEAAFLSHKIQQPVKVTWFREDDLEQDYFGPATVTNISAGLDSQNRIVAWHHKQAHTKGGSQHGCFPSGLVKNYKVEHCKTHSHIRAGAWRGPFHLQWAFPVESTIDELAYAAKEDPLVFRLKLMSPHQAFKFQGWGADTIDSARMATCYKAAADAAEWSRKRPKGVGLGIAGHFCHGSYVAFVLEVSVTGASESQRNRLKLHKAWGAIDCGFAINPDHIRNQMEGGFIEGLNAALFNKVIVESSEVKTKNFHQLKWMRMADAPLEITTTIVDSGFEPSGVGEPPTAPAAASLANAIFAASGKRLRRMPFVDTFTDGITI